MVRRDDTALAPGRRLGPYEIVAPLGAGGMGEVYRARDTRLRREVALKVLPPHLAVDPDRYARFEQEAHAAAALNHPNILAIHDVGTDSGIAFIATELVNGDTLAAIIERGSVPVRTLLDIAVQIADGMASAHAAGIVHRDLKPPNVMVAVDGRVKILDFGLAKQAVAVTATADETILADRTEPGIIVGTVSYMSPEQARGATADYRSDQFSFGLILYEMSTGRKAFAKAESVQTMAAIISEEPPPIDARLPAPLRWVIERCLAKDPPARYESSRDLFRELRSIREHLSEVSTQVEKGVPLAPAARGRWRPWALAALLLGSAIMLAAIAFRAEPALPDQSTYRFTPFSFEPGGQRGAVWSPDGKAVAYAARQAMSDPFQVYVRYLDAPTAIRLTEGAESATPIGWTPDSRRVFLLMGDDTPALWSLAAVGGEPERILSLPPDARRILDMSTVTVSADGKSVALLRTTEDGVEVAISSPPGAPLKTYAPDPYATKTLFNSPRITFSPDGRQLLLVLNAARQGEEAWLLPYPPNAAAPPKRILRDLRSFAGTPSVAWMPDSRHITFSLSAQENAPEQLWLADTISGKRHALTSGTTSKVLPAVAPDGQRLIFSETAGNFDIVSLNLETAAAETLIATERNEWMPAWAPNENTIVYVTDRGGPNEIWIHRPGAADRPIVSPRDFPTGTTWFMAPALSPRADRVIYSRVEGGTVARLWISSVAGGTPIQLTNDSATAEFPGSWSPDGAQFAYYALRDGKPTLMTVRTSGQATPLLVRASRGNFVPVWSPAGDWILDGDNLVSPDGKTSRSLGDRRTRHYAFSRDGRLLYGLRPDKDRQILFAIDVATGGERTIGTPSSDYTPGSNLNPSIRFSLSPDGKRIVYGSGRFKRNLWMLEGFAATKNAWARLGLLR